jgi:hypothetical protein
MGIQGYGLFVKLLKQGHSAGTMGLRGTAGDVARWASRVKLARKFRSLDVDDYSALTLLGYSAFFRVFLTHSALERYLSLVGLSDDGFNEALLPHEPSKAIKEFFERDRSGKLFDFLHPRLNSKLQAKLKKCRDGASVNVSCVSAAVRHIFVHGHLGANTHDINPRQVARSCNAISDFLLTFMETDFTQRIKTYYDSIDVPRPAIPSKSAWGKKKAGVIPTC